MENDIPKIDLPQDWIIGTNITKELLGLYTDFPCRLKAGIFVLCMEGEIEVSFNLIRFQVKPYSFITILPGSIFQIHKIEGNLQIYFMGFSSNFINDSNVVKSTMDVLYIVKETPVVFLKKNAAELMEDYFTLLIKTYELYGSNMGKEMLNHLLSGILLGIGAMYKNKVFNKVSLSKAEQISKNFGQLVTQNYTTQRSVVWYAKKLGITPAHLSTIVKQVTGKTCIEIISLMVIMDAKTQLKSTNLSIHDIAYSLNFTNMSFFGKYFKRYVGMGPQEYRNS
ncbi:helix-turn-helix domain-containing protein [Parabacteroides bouchesdurhonensis]|uniref:helix-turn-helix domain-containing protein n=1 Tax=Parabacteroides bouchesdurhonensis TaxID=1936995 RepID=UPI000E535162|nr:helix-turn-helix domain-containing protein [Parabacteroides bouchesdurhonensis]RHJ94155.1 AraC family transcriptional regulator [Bacteroides sp. AM07-16]